MCSRCGYVNCICTVNDEATVITACDAVPFISSASPIANGAVCDSPTKECVPMNITRSPYYFDAPGIQDHCPSQVLNVYGAVKILTSFNLPDCQGSSVVQLDGITRLLIGSYFWNPNFGYLKVKDFNTGTGQVTLENNCESGNAPEGTQVPSCTNFVVTDAPATTNTSLSNISPFLAADFVAPLNGAIQTIGVTNVNGLAVGKNITLAGGTYTLEQIINSTTVVIRNNGLGVVPNTQVFARNSALELQYPITMIDINACSNTAVNSGALMVCKNDLLQPLDAVAVGSVPVVINSTTNEVQYQILQVPTRTCTALTNAATLAPGNPAAVLTVANTAIFTVGNVLQLGTRTDRFTIGTILDATHLSGTFVPTPGAVENIPIGTSACTVDCCEDNATNIGANRAAAGTVAAELVSSGALSLAPGQFVEGFDAEVIFVNDSPSKQMKVLITAYAVFDIIITGVAAQYLEYTFGPRIGYGVGPVTTVPSPTLTMADTINGTLIIPATRTTAIEGKSWTYTQAFTLNVGEEMRFKVRPRLTTGNNNLGTGIAINELNAVCSGISVAVQV